VFLTAVQKKKFRHEGFLVVPGVVAPVLVDRAVRAINHSLGKGMRPEDVPTLAARSYCPELKQSPAITGLYSDTPASAGMESMLGARNVRPVESGQIALRFPTLDDKTGEIWPHIDGMYSPTNGVAKGTIANFTALLGVYLSDVSKTDAGNLTVWPGSHLLHEQYFRANGQKALLDGMPKVDLGPPLQVTGNPGDVILAHYLLAHGVAPNTSPHTRYAVFFRIIHAMHDQQRWESMTDAWLQWEGMEGT